MNFSPHPISLRQLQYFVAVAKRRSFVQAAQDCHVSQPALSTQIAQAEALLGLQLFERGRDLRLTPAGDLLLGQAQAILEATDALVQQAERLGDPLKGRLRLGLIPTVAPYLLPLIAPHLRSRFPQLQIVWMEEKTAVLLDRLERSELDAAVLALDDSISRLPHIVLGDDPFVLALPPTHPLAQDTGPVSPAVLDGEEVLLLEEGHCFRDQALAWCTRSGATEAGYRSTSLATLVQMAAGGMGVTLLPQLAVDVENRRSALALRPFQAGGPARSLVLAWRRSGALEGCTRPVAEALRAAWQGAV